MGAIILQSPSSRKTRSRISRHEKPLPLHNQRTRTRRRSALRLTFLSVHHHRCAHTLTHTQAGSIYWEANAKNPHEWQHWNTRVSQSDHSFSLARLRLHPEAPEPFFPALSSQYFYSGLALWIKYCVASDPCGFYPLCFFFSTLLSFPSRGDGVRVVSPLGFFSTPGKSGKYLLSIFHNIHYPLALFLSST